MVKNLLRAILLTAALAGCESTEEKEPLGPPGKVHEVPPENFEETILNHHYPVYLAFGTEYCYGCEILKQYMAQLAPEFEGKLFVGVFDVESDLDRASMYIDPVSLPVTVCFYQGEVVYRETDYARMDEDMVRERMLECALLKE